MDKLADLLEAEFRLATRKHVAHLYAGCQPDSHEDSNAAAYFIGVFDTVAALGAKGFRSLWVRILLFLMFTVGAAVPLFAASAVITGLAMALTDISFWKAVLWLTVAFTIMEIREFRSASQQGGWPAPSCSLCCRSLDSERVLD